jgi:hypothetical protein
MESLPRSPLAFILGLLGDVEGWGVQELDVAAHLILHHLLEGLLLTLDLICHRLHRGDPSPSDLFCRLLTPAQVIAHFAFLSAKRTRHRSHIPNVGTLKRYGLEIFSSSLGWGSCALR